MPLPGLTEAVIRERAAEGSFARGERYLNDGAVQEVKKRHEGELEAFVQGSEPNPYVVDVKFGDAGIESATCTCPYHQGGWCKHIAAALLAHLRQHRGEEPSVPTLVAGLERDEIIALLDRLTDRDERVREWVEEELVD